MRISLEGFLTKRCGIINDSSAVDDASRNRVSSLDTPEASKEDKIPEVKGMDCTYFACMTSHE